MSIKKIALTAALVVISSFIIPHSAAAASAITIDGVVYNKKGQPVAGLTVVAWCGGVNFLGGSGVTDTNGHYVIHTDSDRCPLGTELTVSTDTNGDGLSDGARYTQTHTSTTINIHLGDYTSVVIPEYSWVSAGVAALAGIGAFGLARRTRLNAPM